MPVQEDNSVRRGKSLQKSSGLEECWEMLGVLQEPATHAQLLSTKEHTKGEDRFLGNEFRGSFISLLPSVFLVPSVVIQISDRGYSNLPRPDQPFGLSS